MNKLITYLKEGKGRGLVAMLVFSVLTTLLLWWGSYSTLKAIPSSYPNISELNMFWVHLGFILTCMGLTWFLYLLVVAISAFFSWAFRFKLPKGTIWRSATFSIITFTIISVLTSLIGAFLLTILGSVIHSPVDVVNMVIFSILAPIIYMIIFFVLLVLLILYSIRKQKERK